MTAKAEAKPKTPKATKPRLRNVRVLYIKDPIKLKRGQTNYFTRKAKTDGGGVKTSIVADLDAHMLIVKSEGDPTLWIPFSEARYWHPDVGTVTED